MLGAACDADIYAGELDRCACGHGKGILRVAAMGSEFTYNGGLPAISVVARIVHLAEDRMERASLLAVKFVIGRLRSQITFIVFEIDDSNMSDFICIKNGVDPYSFDESISHHPSPQLRQVLGNCLRDQSSAEKEKERDKEDQNAHRIRRNVLLLRQPGLQMFSKRLRKDEQKRRDDQ